MVSTAATRSQDQNGGFVRDQIAPTQRKSESIVLYIGKGCFILRLCAFDVSGEFTVILHVNASFREGDISSYSNYSRNVEK